MDYNANRGLRVLTIGHSNHPMERFLQLLKAHSVQVVVDTRSYPYSKVAPHYSLECLSKTLSEAGFRYVYLGRELGGRPGGNKFYDEVGHVLYGKVAESAVFRRGLSRLEKGIRKYKVAMLCAEENPAICHRRLLVGRVLREQGVVVEHIRGDGRVQTEEQLLAEVNPNGGQMTFFGEVETKEWKSILSVSPKRRQNNSSAS